MSNFSRLKSDKDTATISRIEAELDGHPVLCESWVWDGILGHTIVFIEDDVPGISNNKLIAMVCRSQCVDDTSDVTIKRNDGFVFVNYKFEIL